VTGGAISYTRHDVIVRMSKVIGGAAKIAQWPPPHGASSTHTIDVSLLQR
jgi:hypothetical protein